MRTTKGLAEAVGLKEREKEERRSELQAPEAHIEVELLTMRTHINPAGPNSAPMKSQKNFL